MAVAGYVRRGISRHGVLALASGQTDSKESPQIHEIEQLLNDLKRTPTGIVIYDQLVRVLEEWRAARRDIDSAYSQLLGLLVEAYNRDSSGENITQINAALISARLAQHEDVDLEVGVDDAGPDYGNDDDIQPYEPPGSPETRVEQELAAEPIPEVEIQEDKEEYAKDSGPDKKKDNAAEAGDQVKKVRDASEETQDPSYPAVERRVNSAYRLHLDRKYDEIEKLQTILAQKAAEAIAQNKEFGALLEIERAALEQASSAEEIENLKQILIGGTDELIHGQRALAEKLHVSVDYLRLVESDSKRLHEELNKVRLLSLTDEATGLPNRRAFMRRIEDEIGRAQRYEIPLVMAIMELDTTADIVAESGQVAGDELMRWYADNVLSVFRHHDMVARYNSETFAVLMPNTNREGAMCALKKVNRRAQEVECVVLEEEQDTPTFSAGVTFYHPGEEPENMLLRAEQGIASAKQSGASQIVLIDAENAEFEGSGSGNGP